MKLSFTSPDGAFFKGMTEIDKPIGTAAQAAIQGALKDALTRGKANIASAGLGQRWVDSLKTRFYKNDGLDAAGIIFSGINFGVVFERGAVIKGNPTLWLPLHTTPKKIGGKRLTAKTFHEQIGQLFMVTFGGKEYLAARIAVSKKASFGPLPLMSAAMLRNRMKPPRKGQTTRLVPMFVAQQATTIRKRLHIGQITESAAAKLPKLFAAAIKDE